MAASREIQERAEKFARNREVGTLVKYNGTELRKRLTLKVIGESLGGTPMTARLLALAGRKAKPNPVKDAKLKKIEVGL